jgi:hypothetical protein
MTGEQKVKRTLKAFTEVSDEADAMQLTLASVAMGLESQQGFMASMQESQQSGELDEFVLALTRWIATHRSDDAEQLLVVEIPRGQNIPPGTRLHRLDLAAEAMTTAESPL